MVEVLAISAKSSLLGEGVFCVGFIVAELNGPSIGKVYAVMSNRGNALEFAKTVTPDTPPICDPPWEAFHKLVSTGQLKLPRR
jgi:hypothetical protein